MEPSGYFLKLHRAPPSWETVPLTCLVVAASHLFYRMNYLLVGLLVLATTALLLGSRPARAQPRVPAATPASVPPGPLVVSTLAGHPLRDSYGDGPRLEAWFSARRGLGLEAHGNLYVAGTGELRQVTAAGQVRTLAGSPPEQYVLLRDSYTAYGDYNPRIDGRGLAARMGPNGPLAVAPDGTVYFAETYAVRRLSPRGEVTTLGGSLNKWEGSYRDGSAAEARFGYIRGLALDPAGNLYVADGDNHCIRRISPAGVVSTLAGEPGPGGYGYANGRGRAARFAQVGALAWLPEGALLVRDGDNGCLRRVSAQGEVSLWGGRVNGKHRGTGPGEALDVSDVDFMAAGPDGSVYLVGRAPKDDHTIRRILPDRTEPVRPWAGQARSERATVDAATPGAARFNFPESLAVGPDGTLYVAERGSQLVRTISPGGQVATYAGEPLRTSFDGPGARAELARPRGLALAADGSLLVADYGHDLLRRIDADGNVTTVAGQFRPPDALDTTPEAERLKPHLSGPAAVAVAPDGTIYLACAAEHVIRKLDPQGRLSVWAGQPGQKGSADDGLRGRGKLTAPTSLALAPDGTLYCADEETQAVRRISPTGRLGTLQSGSRAFVGPFSNAGRTVYPTAVAVGSDGAVYVLQGTLHRYPPGRGRAHLLAGSSERGYQDGRGPAARFNYPTGLCVSADGTVYVADFGNQLVRRVSADGEVTTLAGEVGVHQLPQPAPGFTVRNYGPENYLGFSDSPHGDHRDGPAATARFHHPAALALGADGTLYVADQDNNCIRVVRPATLGRP